MQDLASWQASVAPTAPKILLMCVHEKEQHYIRNLNKKQIGQLKHKAFS